MEKTILVAGKDHPEVMDFSDGVLMSGRNVVTTSATGVHSKKAADGGAVISMWNKTSPVSARSLVLECENNFRRLDEALFLFDEAYFAEKFDGMTHENCSRGMDEMILAYQYLAQEVLSRFENRFSLNHASGEILKPAKIVFLLKSSPSEYDILKNNALRNTVPFAAGPFVSAAASAFVALAENIAAMFGGRDYVNVILARAESSTELGKNDRALASWICNYLNEVDNLKTKLNAKQSVSWVKAGSKGPGGFGFLK